MARAGTPLQKVQFQIRHAVGSGKTTIPAEDCWIYLFRHQKVATFAYEIYVDTQKKYHPVSLNEHHGKDDRPPAKLGEDWASVLAVMEARGKPPEPVPYWMLFSPFQLTWSRLCEPGAWKGKGNQATDSNKFFTWAREKRAMEYQAFQAQKGSDVHVATVSTPWNLAYAFADQYEADLRTYQARLMDNDRFLKRYMLAMLNGLRVSEQKSRDAGQKPSSNIQEHLNLTRVWEVEEDIKHDKNFWDGCESKGHSLVQVLEKPPFSPMIEDLTASKAIGDVRASHAMLPVLTRLHENLSKTKVGNTYLARFVQQNEKLILWQDQKYFKFSAEEDGFLRADMVNFKHCRKSVKSYWYFVKAYVTYVEKSKRGRMLEAVKWWADHLYKVHLELGPEIVEGVKPLTFDPYSLRRLQVETTRAMSKVAFFALLDTVYFAYTVTSMVETYRKEGSYEGGKKLISALGAMTSAMSSGLSVVELVTMSQKSFEGVGLALKEAPVPGSFMTPSQAAGKVFDIDIVRHQAISGMTAAERKAILRAGTIASSRGLKSTLGIFGGVFDLVTGTWNGLEEVGTGDTNAAVAHGVTALGGLAVMVGFFLLLSPFAVVGAVLIFAGSVAGLVGSILAVLMDDTDIEDWVKFSYFGKMNAEHGYFTSRKKPKWAEGQSLVAFSNSLELQKNALENILFKVEATCTILDDRFIVDVICRLVVKESRLWLGLEVTDATGRTTVRHKFSAWHDFKYDPANARVRREFMDAGVRQVRLAVQLDVYGDGKLMHPRVPEWFEGTYDYPVGPG